MTINMEQAIAKMMQLQALDIHYSMTGSRTGADGTADCSGAVYAALLKGGAKPFGYVVSTETEHEWLLLNGFHCIAHNQEWAMQRGDILIFGEKGRSAGAGGHTAIAIDGTRVIHCNGTANGVSIDAETSLPYSLGWYVYRQQVAQTSDKPTIPVIPNLVWLPESASFRLQLPIHLRTAPSTKAAIIATLPANSVVKYDAYAYHEGYVWIRQARANHQYGYLATGECQGNRRTSYWGEFF